MIVKLNKPKILFLDIETSPNIGYFWNCGRELSIGHENIIQEREIICIGYKYLGEKKVHSVSWNKKGDRDLLAKIVPVLQGADVVIGHNGDNFDIKWIKGRLLYHRLPPVTNLKSIDTLKLSRSNFNLNSHRLDYLSQYLFNKHKLKTDFSLWKEVIAGNKKSLNYMVKYCKKDVQLLEQAFTEMAPYCERLPVHMGIIKHGGETPNSCPACGHLFCVKNGVLVSATGKYQKYKCVSCGHIHRDRKQLKGAK